MPEFNECAKLVDEKTYNEMKEYYTKLLSAGINPIKIMMSLQLDLQIDLNKKLPYQNPVPIKNSKTTCGEILKFLQKNNDAIDDERRELYTALGGMSNGKDASAVWKTWKAKHQEAYNRPYDELSNEDKLEIKFEMIDQIHFILNQLLQLDISEQDLFILYMLKNKENFNRYKNNY